MVEAKSARVAARILEASPRALCQRIDVAALLWVAPVADADADVDVEVALLCFVLPPGVLVTACDEAPPTEKLEVEVSVDVAEATTVLFDAGGSLTRTPETGVTVPSSPSAFW